MQILFNNLEFILTFDEEKVIHKRNLRDRCVLVNLWALISKMHVIQASEGAFAYDFKLRLVTCILYVYR